MRCGSCSADVPDHSKFCLSCGAQVSRAPLDSMNSTELLTQAAGPVRATSSSAVDEGRFLPGTLLASRYRVIGLLGRGGMGEVYRATDLKLEQPVALKFLPDATAANPAILARFHTEVRIARQVSHPNVCRVYDIGDVKGHAFLSMEYVDGEDLGSLLRRIGRLPQDKAVELARKLCAGLAAAHDRGVLHRDLKPANVMIDGRGQLRITDFGLAAIVDQVQATDLRSGTPAYMAPEQLAGREVSVKSDIYSLGLVLYEMFTGKHAFEASTLAELVRKQDEMKLTTPSELVKELDPAVERVILRCLERDPRGRPASALAVAAALPGGDPLAAALAAGETPSPEMVAMAGETAGLRATVAVPCLAAVIVLLVIVTVLSGRVNLIAKVPFDIPPEALELKAQEMIHKLGYAERSLDTAHGFVYSHAEYVRYVERQDSSSSRWAHIASGRPALLRFWYRESPRYLEADDFFNSARVTREDPPVTISGMVGIELDPQARLLSFQAVPPQIEENQPPAGSVDWSRLFAAAGLDLTRFTPADPKWAPATACDARAAWTGAFPETPKNPLRVEAAAWRGRPVYFELIGSWTRPARMQPFQWTTRQRAIQVMNLVLFLIAMAGAALLARHNSRLNRGDRRGAVRLTSAVFAAGMLEWLLIPNHRPTFGELGRFIMGVSWYLFFAAVFWMLYIALEPYVRRKWPQALISWSRLLSGRIRDPLVGCDLLVGLLCGCSLTLLFQLRTVVNARAGGAPPAFVTPDTLLGVRYLGSQFLETLIESVGVSLMLFFLFFLLRVLVRREWIAGAIFVLLFASFSALRGNYHVTDGITGVLVWTLFIVLLLRFGLLAVTAAMVTESALLSFPITSNLSSWYSNASLFILVSVAVLAVYAFRLSLAGRPLFQEGLLND